MCTCCMDKYEFSIVKDLIDISKGDTARRKCKTFKFESGVLYFKKECKETVMRKGGVFMLKT